MNCFKSVIALVIITIASPVSAQRRSTVFLSSDNDCAISAPSSGFSIAGLTLGSPLELIESRKDCIFYKQSPGPAFPRRNNALSQEGEICLTAYDPSLHKVIAQNWKDPDCSKLRFYGQVPDVLYCFFEKESSSTPPLLNEIFASLPGYHAADVLTDLETTYGPGKRIVLPNQTVEYRWKNANSVLSLFVMMSSSCVYLETSAKRVKYEKTFGGMLPGFSIESAKEVKQKGGSLMAESEKNKDASK